MCVLQRDDALALSIRISVIESERDESEAESAPGDDEVESDSTLSRPEGSPDPSHVAPRRLGNWAEVLWDNKSGQEVGPDRPKRESTSIGGCHLMLRAVCLGPDRSTRCVTASCHIPAKFLGGRL